MPPANEKTTLQYNVISHWLVHAQNDPYTVNWLNSTGACFTMDIQVSVQIMQELIFCYSK